MATGDVRRVTALPIALAVAVLVAAPATAVPDCTDIAPNTRICQTAGHSAIVTSPNPALTNPYPGWGYGPLGFGLGGMWIGR
ncbi:MAG: hypothetical protein WCK99_05390 [Mycobacteriaceae bacterium]